MSGPLSPTDPVSFDVVAASLVVRGRGGGLVARPPGGRGRSAGGAQGRVIAFDAWL